MSSLSTNILGIGINMAVEVKIYRLFSLYQFSLVTILTFKQGFIAAETETLWQIFLVICDALGIVAANSAVNLSL